MANPHKPKYGNLIVSPISISLVTIAAHPKLGSSDMTRDRVRALKNLIPWCNKFPGADPYDEFSPVWAETA